ncbi:DUF2019 domain-containing protein [Echinicola strongylocentroti]|nr:DUF2019 domain-containing protein [Echinicola strongylocentroti]
MKHDILEKYIAAAQQYESGTLIGNRNQTNKAYKKLNAFFKELKASNQLDKLLVLTGHENCGVKMWAATHILPVNEETGLRVLDELASNLQGGLFGFDAKMTIQEWKKGNLTYLTE